MCRLMAGHSKTLDLIPQNEMISIFDELEKLQGGAGNGLAGTFADGTVRRLRGIAFTCKEAAAALYKWKNEGLILWQFHTRLVSSGSKTDDQCHPHFCFDEERAMRGFLMQNGTLSGSDYEFLKRLFGGRMDTEVVANALFKIRKPQKEILLALNAAVWVLTTKTGTFAVNANKWNGDLIMYQKCHAIISSPLLDKHGDKTKIESRGWVNIDNKGKITYYKGVEKTYTYTGSLYDGAETWRRYYALQNDEEFDDGPVIQVSPQAASTENHHARIQKMLTPIGGQKRNDFAIIREHKGYDIFKIIGSGDNGKAEKIAHAISRSNAIKAMRGEKCFCCAIADDRSDVLVDNFSTLYWVFSPKWEFLGYTKNYKQLETFLKDHDFVNVRGKLQMELRPVNMKKFDL